jgi:thiamine biosynthesis lipoprotein
MRYFTLGLVISFLFFTRPIELKRYHITGNAQGTSYSILYYASDSIIKKSQIDSILKKLDSSLSLYQPYSLISRFNASQKGIRIDRHFINVVNKSLETYKLTNGLFDITVQPLVQAWGFGPTKIDSLPGKQYLSSLLKCVGSNLVELNGDFLSKKKPCVKIDLNGIAQGYSVDVLANFLESKMVMNYLVELGGEIRVKGRKPSGEQMNIGIEAPNSTDFRSLSVQRIVNFDSGAVTTSGSFRKFYVNNGKKITHIIDPKTGYPVQNDLISVTVYAKNAITADAYDNALMLMGLKRAMQFIEEHRDMAAYFIYTTKDGKIADTASSRFQLAGH